MRFSPIPRSNHSRYAPRVGCKVDLKTLVAHNIRKYRKLGGMSQATLAKSMGVDPSEISKIEARGGNLTLEMLDKIARGLGIPAHLLIAPEAETTLCVEIENLEAVVLNALELIRAMRKK